jgi:3D (Asp-Asp-Asp) domain-containing protein
MAQGFVSVTGPERVMNPVCAVDSEVFAEGSPVTINGDGFLAVASSSGEKIFGFCTQAVTVSATNSTGATAGVTQTTSSTAVGYAPRVIAPDNVLFWADSDTAFAQTDVGAYCDIASESAGVVTLNLAATTSGQFIVEGLLSNIDPSAVGDTDRVVVRVAEPQELGFAQA